MEIECRRQICATATTEISLLPLLNIYRELNSQCLFCFTDNSPAICHNLFLILALIWSQPVHSRGITTLGLSAVLPQFRAFWLHELCGNCEGEMGVELYTSIYTSGKCIWSPLYHISISSSNLNVIFFFSLL